MKKANMIFSPIVYATLALVIIIISIMILVSKAQTLNDVASKCADVDGKIITAAQIKGGEECGTDAYSDKPFIHPLAKDKEGNACCVDRLV